VIIKGDGEKESLQINVYSTVSKLTVSKLKYDGKYGYDNLYLSKHSKHLLASEQQYLMIFGYNSHSINGFEFPSTILDCSALMDNSVLVVCEDKSLHRVDLNQMTLTQIAKDLPQIKQIQSFQGFNLVL
jgi:hypothetical protein